MTEPGIAPPSPSAASQSERIEIRAIASTPRRMSASVKGFAGGAARWHVPHAPQFGHCSKWEGVLR
jgi:hypothetical protein